MGIEIIKMAEMKTERWNLNGIEIMIVQISANYSEEMG